MDCPHRLITLHDARLHGVDRFAVAAACRAGRLERLAPGLYVIAGARAPRRQLLAAPQRYLDGFWSASGRDPVPAALTAESALEVRGIQAETRHPKMTVAMPPYRQVRFRCGLFDTVRVPWAPVVVETIGGIRTVDVAHALGDIAAREGVDDPTLRTAVDRARHGTSTTICDMVPRWEALGTHGARRLLRLEAAGDFEQESEGERRAFAALFPTDDPPDCQVVLMGPLRVDFVYLDALLVIEYHGRDAHEGRLEEDATRILALEMAGYRVIVVTAVMLRDPEALRSFITDVRADRRSRMARGTMPVPPLPVQAPRRRPLRTLTPRVIQQAA